MISIAMRDVEAWEEAEAPGSGRQLVMTCALGADVLIPTSLALQEAISEPYLAIVDAVSTQAGPIQLERLLHLPACVSLRRPGRPVRHVHGVVRRAVAAPPGRRGEGCTIEIVPRLWF